MQVKNVFMWANCLIFSRKLLNILSETVSALAVSAMALNTGLNGVNLTHASVLRSVSVRRSGFKQAQNIAPANHVSIHKGSERMTYRFEVKVFEAFCYRTYFGSFSVDSPLTGVGQEILPVIELHFDFWSKIYTLADAITLLPSVIFLNNTFLGLRFFTQDFSVVEGLNNEDEAYFIYDLVQGEGAGDVIYFPVNVNTKCRVAQVQDEMGNGEWVIARYPGGDR